MNPNFRFLTRKEQFDIARMYSWTKMTVPALCYVITHASLFPCNIPGFYVSLHNFLSVGMIEYVVGGTRLNDTFVKNNRKLSPVIGF